MLRTHLERQWHLWNALNLEPKDLIFTLDWAVFIIIVTLSNSLTCINFHFLIYKIEIIIILNTFFFLMKIKWNNDPENVWILFCSCKPWNLVQWPWNKWDSDLATDNRFRFEDLGLDIDYRRKDSVKIGIDRVERLQGLYVQ